MELRLSEQSMYLAHYNPRAEKAGDDEQVQAADLRLEFDTSNNFLEKLDPQLKSALFGPPSEKSDLADGGMDSPTLRFPFIKKLPDLDLEMLNAQVTIALKTGAPIVLKDSSVQIREIVPLEGGTVSVICRVQFHPTDRQAGKLSTSIKEQVIVTIEPGEVAAPKQQEIPPEE